jgi:quercetin dioxygenase-like cupin family protein
MVIGISPAHMVVYDGAVLNVYHANKGEGLSQHTHNYSHLTICHAGSCVIRKEGKELVVTKDSKPVNLLADGWHEIEALEDNTVFCNVFSEGKL